MQKILCRVVGAANTARWSTPHRLENKIGVAFKSLIFLSAEGPKTGNDKKRYQGA